MSMNTDLKGRLRNTKLPKTKGLIPLFEAVVNSIHAIEEAGLDSATGKISIKIIRGNELELDTDKSIIGFEITDNGVGFNDKNMDSFNTLDSQYKREKGCRGIGRLMWLLAFKTIKIESIYLNESGQPKKINFLFNAENGVNNINREDAISNNIGSTLCLGGFFEKYQLETPKKIESIANSLLEHCLWYFIRSGSAPEIKITDGDEVIQLSNIYEQYMLESTPEQLKIREHTFELTHIRLHTHSSQEHVIAYCASNRLVKEILLNGKIPGLFGRIRDNNYNEKDFIYACYVSSIYLDENVRAERTGFDIDEDLDGLLPNNDLSLNTITKTITESASKYLDNYLLENKKSGRERVENFISQKNPRYRPILARIPENKLYVDPNIDDKKLELMLHEQLAIIQGSLIEEGQRVMSPKSDEKDEDYLHRVEEYIEKVTDINMSDLAGYVAHRKVVLDLLEKSLQLQSNGAYVKEELIHKLIMPLRMSSNQISNDACNLWLIDERLAFHNYLASDKTIKSMPITDSTDIKEPDITALNIFDNPIFISDSKTPPFATLTIIEIKRPMRDSINDNEKNDPIKQVIDYLKRIREGNVRTASGRPIPNSMDIPGFCYVLCDINANMVELCEVTHDMKQTSDKMGYFKYHDKLHAYIEVISFDKLLIAAKERNRAFFDKLGLPTI